MTLRPGELDGVRLSPQQRRLWELGARSPDAPYRARCAVDLSGAVDEAAVVRALERLVAGHEILRTRFRSLPGMSLPLQVVEEEGQVGWLPVEPGLSPEQEDRELWRASGSVPFEPERGPSLAAALVRRRQGYRLVLALPALAADRAGLEVLVRELARLYGQEVGSGAAGDGGGEVLQYADLSAWLNEPFEADASAGREYWRETDLSRSGAWTPAWERGSDAGAAFTPHRLALAVPGTAVGRAAAGSAAETFFLTCWLVLLRRLARSPEGLVGVAFDGRNFAELEELPGLFVRYLPVAARIELERSFADLRSRVETLLEERAAWQECFSWQDLAAGDGPSWWPLGFEHLPATPAPEAAGVVFRIRRRAACCDHFGLRLLVEPRREDVLLELEYDACRYRRSDVRRLAGQLATLVTAAAESPQTAAGELRLMPAAEEHLLLVELSSTPGAELPGVSPDRQPVHRTIAGKAARAGDRVAVCCDDRWLTYGELDDRAHGLAAELAARGVGPEVVVLLDAERDEAAVVGMLGILKAGGAFAPVDPSTPQGRLTRLLDELAPPAVVTRRPLLDRLPSPQEAVLIADAGAGGDGLRAPAALPAVRPENLAYVLYTSGSTGRPKGVMVEHRQLSGYVAAVRSRLRLAPGWRYALVTTLAADLGHTMTFPALTTGGCLLIVGPDLAADPGGLAELMQGRRIDCLKVVPSHLRALLAGRHPGRVLPRRRLVLGGEELPGSLVDGLRQAGCRAQVFNHYGPTEATVGATAGAVAAGRGQGTVAPLGRPLANSRVYLTDRRLRPVPTWAEGELLIGGAGLARGYHGRPSTTAERFVPDPFGAPGGRLYRTGDRARHRPGGQLEFRGRVDRQVKLRGYRIELGEVESTVAGHPRVREAVAVLGERSPGEPRLVVYAVAAAERPSGDELRAWMADRLPEAMQPAAYLFLDALPLTPNGKLDRAALPAVEESPAAGRRTPRTPNEEILLSIWAEVLGRESLGVNESFFDLGGHSLLATQVISRAARALDVDLALRDLFEAPTVAALASRVEAAVGAGMRAAPPIEAEPCAGSTPLSYNQQRLWFLDQLSPGDPSYNIFLPDRLRGGLDVAALERTLDEIVRRHAVLRTTYPATEGRPRQVVQPPVALHLPVIDLGGLSPGAREEACESLGRREAGQPLDLAQSPLLRARLVRLAGEEHVLLITLHHIASDGWSFGVLQREGAALYEAFRRGAPPPLAELPIQYADFARWQRRWLQGPKLEELLRYWKERLAGAPPLLRLPSDLPRGEQPSHRGGVWTFQLGRELSDGLAAVCRRLGVTVFVALLAAFKVLLYRYSGQSDLVVGSPMAGRTRLELEGLVGFFVNTLALRTDLSGNPTFAELLGRVRDGALRAYAHQDLPFELLVDALGLERDLRHSPLYQVWFVLQNTPGPDGAPPELEIVDAEIDGGVVRHDLKLDLKATPQGFRGKLYYRADLFFKTTIQRMSEELRSLLQEVVSDPHLPIEELVAHLVELDQKRRASHGKRFNHSVQESLQRLRRRRPEGPAVAAQHHLAGER